MSKVFAIGLALTLGLAVAQPANAWHRYCRCYGGYYSPSYTYAYSNPNYGYGTSYTTNYGPTAPPVATTTPAPGTVAQSQNGVYRSFSDEPGQAAAPAMTSQSAPVVGFAVPAAPAPAFNYGTDGNPYGANPGTIGGTPSSGSNYGTAGNPYGASGGVSSGGGMSGGTTGGTAGRPY